MRQLGISIVLSLCTLPLAAQDPPAEKKDAAGATSVFGDDFAGMQDMPKMPDSIQVTNDGKLEFDSEKGIFLFEGQVAVTGDNGLTVKANKAVIKTKEEMATLTGKVSVRQKSTQDDTGRIIPGIQLFADSVLLDAKKKTVTLDGNVSIYQGPTLQRGDHAVYNYETKKLHTQGLASKLGPIIMESDHFNMVEKGGKTFFVGENAGVTTHDVEHPNYWIRSERTTIYPDDRIVFKNLKLYAGETPIFWFPYLSQPLDADLGLHIIPGARSNWGAYLLNSYGIMLGGEKNEETGERENAWLLSKWHMDIRSQRGVAGGLDLFDTRLDSNQNLGWMKLYYLNDNNPTLKRTDEPRENVNADRWKIEFKHRFELFQHDESSTYADFNIVALSDRYFLEDFEPGAFKIDPNPNNEIGLFHRNPKFLAGIYTRLRLNEFYESDTRLPELFLDQVRGPIFNTPILHEGQTTMGIYREQLADYHERDLRREADSLPSGDPRRDQIEYQLQDRGYSRFHTWHEFSIPLNLDGKITIVPRAGVGLTSYWDLQDDTDSSTRAHASIGVDTSMKFSKVYSDIHSKAWGVDELLHVFQPYANFSQLTSNNTNNNLRGIETLTPSTRPPEYEVGRFPATDDLENWTVLRLGGRNTLLSKRNGDSHRWLAMDTYINVFLNDLESSRTLSNLYNDIIWSPLPWVKLDIETQFPITHNAANFSELASHLTFMPNDSMEMRFGYRILDNHPTLRDSNRVDFRTYTRINSRWGLGTYHRYEFDDNTLEVQQYAVHHDFDSWRTSLGVILRDNREGRDEYGLLLNFTLKNFPSIQLPLSIDSE